jgi:hypothetical protein
MHADRARSGEAMGIDPGPARNGTTGAVAPVRGAHLELMRWFLPAGRSVPEHMSATRWRSVPLVIRMVLATALEGAMRFLSDGESPPTHGRCAADAIRER